jgi:hypothetical protein
MTKNNIHHPQKNRSSTFIGDGEEVPVHWLLLASITINMFLAAPNNNAQNLSSPTLEEGNVAPDGRIILMVNRSDLDLATAIIESESRCRKELINCAEQTIKPPFPWAWVTGSALTFLVIGFAAGHFL